MKISKSSIKRKLQRESLKFLKVLKPVSNVHEHSVLVNSFPKSGTHLLKQLFLNMGFDDFLQHPASIPSYPHKLKSVKKDIKDIYKIRPNEMICGHIIARDELRNLLEHKKNIIHFFIYRDLRDVIASEVHYLTKMNKFHSLHKFFKAIPTHEERIEFGIRGNDFIQTPYSYPNIKERFAWYMNWLSDANTHAIKFEDLISEKTQDKTINGVADYLISKGFERFDKEQLVEIMKSNINPSNSHTYTRKGGQGRWKKVFSQRNLDLFNSLVKD